MDEMTRLRKQVEELSFRVTMLERRLNVAPQVPVKDEKAVVPAPAVKKSPQPAPERESLEQRVGGTWLNRLGVIALVMGLGFFLKYAFDNNWIGVIGRLAIGVLIGAVCFALGHYYNHRGGLPRFGVGLLAAGVGAWYVTCYAAYGYYLLLKDTAAFTFFLAITVIAGVLALSYNSGALLGLASVSGFLTPLLIGGSLGFRPVILYLLLLNGALLAVVARRSWHAVAYINLIGTYAVFLTVLERFDSIALRPQLLFYLSLLQLVFAAYALVISWIRKTEGTPQATFLWITSLIYVFITCATFEMKQSIYLTSAAIFWIILYLVGYVWLRMSRPEDTTFRSLLLMLSVGHLTVLIPVTFTLHWITFAWVLQAAMLFVLGQVAIKRARVWSLVPLGLAFFRVIYFDYRLLNSLYYFTHVSSSGMAARLGVLASAVAVCIIIGGLYHRLQDTSAFEKRVAPLLILCANALLLFGALRETSIYYYLLRDGQAYSAWWPRVSAAYTIFMIVHGLSLIAAGVLSKLSYIRKMGIALLLATVAKIVLVDLTGLDTVWRIVVFMATGIVLIAASYLYQRYVVTKPDNTLES